MSYLKADRALVDVDICRPTDDRFWAL